MLLREIDKRPKKEEWEEKTEIWKGSYRGGTKRRRNEEEVEEEREAYKIVPGGEGGK